MKVEKLLLEMLDAARLGTHTRLDSRQAANALMSTVAYAGSE